MKQLKRVVALILTVVLAVYGLPMTPMAFAVESIDDTGEAASTPTMPSTAMRFVQTDFDESTGILTMSLQIKPNPGANNETVREGVFAFQVDATRVVPITNPRANGDGVTEDEVKEFRTYNGEIAAAITVDSSSTQVIKDFANSGSQYVNLVSTSNKFDLTMNSKNMFSKYTGFLVSGTRFQTGKSSMVDCYFQFYLDTIGDIKADEDGYVNIIDLKFQCYDSDGKTKATSTEVLSAGSIRMPEADEIDDIIKQFSFKNASGETISMAMGAAGFVQQYKKSNGITTEGNAYYYYGKQPELNKWRKNGGSRNYWAKTPLAATELSANDTAPGIWYENCDKKYLVEELRVSNANTLEGDAVIDPENEGQLIEVTNPDFTYPTGSNGTIIESGHYPRYLIPSYTQSLTNDTVKNWIPEAYQGNGKRPALKYYASTSVADGSITTPEEEDYTGFVEGLEWQIVLPNGTQQGVCLEDVEVTETEGDGTLVETGDGSFYRVKEATVTDEEYSTEQWFGKSLWNVYIVADKDDDSKDEYLMKMPIGITLDFITSDVISVDGTTGNETVHRVKAPQLHMTYEAAEPRSVIWNTNASNTTVSGEKCKLGLRAVYIDGDRKVYGETMDIGLYKNDATPSTIDIYDDGVVTTVTNAQGTSVDGFWVGNTKADGTGEETPNDIIANGAGIRVVLCDQYHVGYDTKFPTVELVPTSETEKTYKSAGKTNPFVVERADGNEYTIIYRDGADVNDAVKGEYVLRAVYTATNGSKVTKEKKIYINKTDDKLSLLRTGLSYNYSLNNQEEVEGGIVYDITYSVPVRSGDNRVVTANETITLLEIANQWRDKEVVPDDLSRYDIVRNLRTSSNAPIEIAKARDAGYSVSIETSSPDGDIPQGIDVSKLNSTGEFTFNSNTLDASKLNIKVTVSYNGYSRFVEYNMTFARELPRLSEVKIYTPSNQPTYKITVPLKTESDAQQIIEVVPLDQYGSTWNWEDAEDAYTPGNRLNPDASAQPFDKWSVLVDGELPDGVTISGENNNIITVTKEAKNSEFKIYAKYAAATSEKITVEVVRKPSKPTTVSNLTYNDTNEIISPPVKRSNLTVKPSVKVYDQYDEEMTSCPQTWKVSVVSDVKNASDYIHIDSKTGELTVDKCAPNCTLTITVRYSENGGTKSQKCTVQVKRETISVDSVTITSESFPYPALDDNSDIIKYLAATGTTQYGESEKLDSDTLTWTLDSVEFADATLVRTVSGSDVETGDIPYNSSTGVYSARGMISVTTHGGVSFSRATIENNVPRAITVTVTTNNSQKATKRIVISREISVPNTMYISKDVPEYDNGIQLPHKGDTAVVALKAYVRDQYGVIMDSANIEWNNVGSLPSGVKLDKAAKTITVDHTTSENASISLTASCKVSETKTLTQSLNLAVFSNEPLVAQDIELVSVKDSTGTASTVVNAEAEMTLPAQTGLGYSSYTAVCRVKDQFDRPVQKSVKWSVVSADSGVDARISDAADGIVRLYYTQDALDSLVAGTKLTFTMRVEADENSTVYKDMKVSLKLNEAEATYASPVLVTNEGIGNINSDGEPIVPKKGEAANTVKISTVVYDQYGRVMSGEHGEIELLTQMTGITLRSLTGTGSSLLDIASNVTGTLVTVRATPKNKSSNVNDNSTLQIRLNKGTAYAAELALEEENEYTFDIPEWVSEQMNNAPDEDTYETLTLGAKIVDQYGAEMTSNSNMYMPTWEFIGEHEGVEFDTSAKAAAEDEKVDGQTVTLKISNRAIPQGKMSETVTLKVKAGNMADDSFTKTFTITLNRNSATATFFYIQGANADGEESEPPMRPHADEKKTIYQFKPTVYDQYGAAMNVEGIVMDMNIAALEELDNIEVEQEFNRGESAEKGDEPAKYHVYRVIYKDENDTKGTKTLLADFDRATGELVIYTECDCIEQFMFTAKYSALGVVGSKTLVVPVGQETLRAYTVKVNRTHGDFKVRGTEDPIYDFIYTTIYDQYGDEYTGGVNIVWDLLLNEKDDQGNYKEYTSELDKEGYERPASEFLVQKTNGSDGTTTLTVLPESFFEAKSFILRCTVVDRNAQSRDDWVVTDTVINVRKPSSGSSGIVVTFDPGEYGKLVGESSVTIVSGAAPEVTPGVKTVEGYGFVGWTTDGDTIVDATKIAVFGDTVYSAVYKDVTGTKFVEGYDDMTIKPENHITRAEFVTMVVRAIGGYDSSKDYGESFADVSPKMWYANTIAYAKQMNLIDGYEDGTFKPNSSITRAEAAKILAEAAGLTSENTGTFPDVADGKWYTPYIEALAEKGIIIGYADGTFRPANKITRAEAIKMIVMITVNSLNDFERENIQKYAYCAFTDIRKTHWAYAYILRGAGIA